MNDRRIKEVVTPDRTMSVEQFLRTVPPERRAYFLNAFAEINRRRIEAQRWVDQKLQDTLVHRGKKGCPYK